MVGSPRAAVKISVHRALMGSTEHVRFLGAVAVIVVDGARVLALRRAATRDAGAGLWEVVSGRVRIGESLEEAAHRETFEETGLEVELDPRPVDAYQMERGSLPMLLVVYRARLLSGEVCRSEEHDDHAWCTAPEFRRRTTLSRLADAVDRAVSRDGVGREV